MTACCPIEGTRGAPPRPRLFLEKKEGKNDKPKTSFSAGDYRFLRKRTFAWRENMRFLRK